MLYIGARRQRRNALTSRPPSKDTEGTGQAERQSEERWLRIDDKLMVRGTWSRLYSVDDAANSMVGCVWKGAGESTGGALESVVAARSGTIVI